MVLVSSSLVVVKWLPMRADSEIQLLHDSKNRLITSALLNRFIEAIPTDIRAKAIRFSHLQHTILRLMKQTRATIDLVDSNPILLWIIAGEVAANKLTYHEAKTLIEGKQAVALRQLFPNRETLSAGFVKRIQAAQYNAREFQLVNDIMGDDTLINSLQHCKNVRLDIFEWFSFNRSLVEVPCVKRLIAGEC
jgi:hypothetical protein